MDSSLGKEGSEGVGGDGQDCRTMDTYLVLTSYFVPVVAKKVVDCKTSSYKYSHAGIV